MKYIVDIPEEYTKHGYSVYVKTWGEYFKGYNLNPEPYIELDGCKGCKYDDREEWEEPCKRCCNAHKNMWRSAKE